MAAEDVGDLADGKRHGCGTWLVPVEKLPAVAKWMTDTLPEEKYDPPFHGQHLHTTYFDTLSLKVRKARNQGDRYAVLRLRCYQPGEEETYALSVKTESEKWRETVSEELAEALTQRVAAVLQLLEGTLPSHLMARLLEVTAGQALMPSVMIHCHRYAVENQTERLSLDVNVHTDTGKVLGAGVLEYKNTDAEAVPPGSVWLLGLRPAKLSKFLWATGV
jgi:hypothetical protein